MGKPQRVDGGWLWIGGPVPPRCSTCTIGSLVIVRRSVADSAHGEGLVRRERARAARIAEVGWIGYLARYAKDYVGFRARGYSHAQARVRVPLEVEARVDGRGSLNDHGSSAETEASSHDRRVDAPSSPPVTPVAVR